jgi:hypothetical protein
MAKLIRVSDDNGANWHTLPGGSGELTRESASAGDTVFGQTFESNQPTLITWNVQAGAFYKGYAGYVATIKKKGTSTPETGAALTLVSGKRYRLNTTTKRIIDRATAYTVKDNAVAVAAANIESVNFLFGEVVFVSTYTPTGAITMDYNYFPVADVGGAKSYSLKMTAAPVDTTTYALAQANGGYRTHSPGLRSVSIDLSGIYASANGFAAMLASREEVIIEINPDGASKSLCRGFFKLTSDGQSGDVGAPEEESLSFSLAVPDPTAKAEIPFGWSHDAATVLSTAVQKVLNAWEDETALDVQYLPDGTNGFTGDCIVTDTSLAGSLDGMNEFSVSLRGSGAMTAVP